jgi:NAD(P) transhydrogenase subunit alpha
MAELMSSLFIFVLAMFAGFEVIRKVPSTLHTPLMSGANAISGVILIGALIVAGQRDGGAAVALGLVAVILATINVVGGFLVTDRMLRMFRKERERS